MNQSMTESELKEAARQVQERKWPSSTIKEKLQLIYPDRAFFNPKNKGATCQQYDVFYFETLMRDMIEKHLHPYMTQAEKD